MSGTPNAATRFVRVLLRQVMPQTAEVVVEVPTSMTEDDLRKRLGEVYEEVADDLTWESDARKNCVPGKHEVLGPADPGATPHYRYHDSRDEGPSSDAFWPDPTAN